MGYVEAKLHTYLISTLNSRDLRALPRVKLWIYCRCNLKFVFGNERISLMYGLMCGDIMKLRKHQQTVTTTSATGAVNTIHNASAFVCGFGSTAKGT